MHGQPPILSWPRKRRSPIAVEAAETSSSCGRGTPANVFACDEHAPRARPLRCRAIGREKVFTASDRGRQVPPRAKATGALVMPRRSHRRHGSARRHRPSNRTWYRRCGAVASTSPTRFRPVRLICWVRSSEGGEYAFAMSFAFTPRAVGVSRAGPPRHTGDRALELSVLRLPRTRCCRSH